MALDGWYGIDWPAIVGTLKSRAAAVGLRVAFHSTTDLFKSREIIADYRRAFTETSDPGFGIVNTDGHISDLMDAEKVQNLRAAIETASGSDGLIVYGVGAAIPELCDGYDVRCYFDKTRQPILWEMWGGQLIPFGWNEPKRD